MILSDEKKVNYASKLVETEQGFQSIVKKESTEIIRNLNCSEQGISDDETLSDLSNGVKLSPAACDISIKEITEENFQQCLQLKASVPEIQFVDTVEYSLAEAWLYYKDMRPFAIYLGSNIIGFVSMYTGEENYQIINFLIDDMYRGAGMGTKAAKICIDYLSKNYGAKRMSVPVHERHLDACKFWKKLGFGLSDSIEDGYIYMRLEL